MVSSIYVHVPHSGKLSREKTFANFTVLWLYICESFLCKIWGHGTAKASNPWKFSPKNVFSTICQSFLPQKFLLAVACYSTLKSDTIDIWKRFYGVFHHSSATCATLKCTSEASELKTDLRKAEAKLHKLAFSEKCAQCMHARGLLCLWAKLSATSVQIFAFWFSKNSSNLHQSCAANVCLNLQFFTVYLSPMQLPFSVTHATKAHWLRALFGGRSYDVMFNQETQLLDWQ